MRAIWTRPQIAIREESMIEEKVLWTRPQIAIREESMIEEKVLDTIKKYNLVENGDRVVVGVSGGPDSICLIDLLYKIKIQGILNFEIVVCHINHLIREEAETDELFVQSYCDKRNIPFFAKRVKVEKIAKIKKISTEEAGREVRYDFFNEVLEKMNFNKIATAHTKNDNAETVIMNILRGSGISGLKGITAIRDNKYIKPLIEISREEIEAYCYENKLNPRYDRTNEENIYTRNKIRNILIPELKKEFNPNIIDTIARLSRVVEKENQYIEKITQKTYQNIMIKENKREIILDLKEFNKEDEVIKSRIVLYTIKKLIGNANGIGKIHIDDIIRLSEKNIGNKYLTPNKHIKILVNKGKMHFFVI